MSQAIPSYPLSSRPHLHVVGEEDRPTYDGEPVVRERRHMTVVDDDIVESVASTCGLSGLGLYTLLERRANKEGVAFGSYQAYADMSRMSRRQLMRVMDDLIAHGWVEKRPQNGRNGAQMSNAWHLPNHMKPRTYRGDMGGDIPSDMGGDIGGDINGARVSPQSSYVVTSSPVGNTPSLSPSSKPKPKRNAYTPEFEAFWQAYPTGHGVKSLAFAEWQKMTDEERTSAVDALPVWRTSKKWTDGFIRDCERWLKYREFEQTPEASKRIAAQPEKRELIVNGKSYPRRGWVE